MLVGNPTFRALSVLAKASFGTGEDVRIAEMRGQATEAVGDLPGAKRTRLAIPNLFNFEHFEKALASAITLMNWLSCTLECLLIDHAKQISNRHSWGHRNGGPALHPAA
jgi:hypothetical protein